MKDFFEKFKDFTKKEGSIPILATAALVLVGITVLAVCLLGGGKDKGKAIKGDYVPTESYTVDVVSLPEYSGSALSGTESIAENIAEIDFRELIPDIEYGEEEKKVDLEITEENFVPQIYSVVTGYDANGYINQTFKITGVSGTSIYNGVTYHDVYRMALLDDTPEGHTERIGLEYIYDGEYPADGTWITVTGVLRAYIEGDTTYLTLDAISVEPAEEQSYYVSP